MTLNVLHVGGEEECGGGAENGSAWEVRVGECLRWWLCSVKSASREI